MSKLESLITERKKELQELEDNRGTRFFVTLKNDGHKTRKQEAEVLQVFAEWGLGHD